MKLNQSIKLIVKILICNDLYSLFFDRYDPLFDNSLNLNVKNLEGVNFFHKVDNLYYEFLLPAD